MKSSNTFIRKPLVIAISGALAGTSPVVLAQSADDGADVLEEILVTASRREQRIEDIPYNISAVDGGDIEDQNIMDSAELMRSIAGVSVIDRGYRNAGHVNSLIIRGVNVDNGVNGDIPLSAAATVATYVDNTPLFANFLLKDIQRVEVSPPAHAPGSAPAQRHSACRGHAWPAGHAVWLQCAWWHGSLHHESPGCE